MVRLGNSCPKSHKKLIPQVQASFVLKTWTGLCLYATGISHRGSHLCFSRALAPLAEKPREIRLDHGECFSCVSRLACELLFSFPEILNMSDESPEHNTETVQIIPPRKQTSKRLKQTWVFCKTKRCPAEKSSGLWVVRASSS